jgi:hypothetical protein
MCYPPALYHWPRAIKERLEAAAAKYVDFFPGVNFVAFFASEFTAHVLAAKDRVLMGDNILVKISLVLTAPDIAKTAISKYSRMRFVFLRLLFYP